MGPPDDLREAEVLALNDLDKEGLSEEEHSVGHSAEKIPLTHK